jgi:Anaphase-promoting complex subunit 5
VHVIVPGPATDTALRRAQSAAYLTTRELGSPEARICYERAEPLCQSLRRPPLLHVALVGQWRHTLFTDKVSAAMQIAERVYSLSQEHGDPAQIIWACNALAGTLYFLGDFEASGQNAMRGLQIWRSGNVQSHPEDVDIPVLSCLLYKAVTEWHLGEIASCQATIAEAIALAKELNDTNALALALNWAAFLAYLQRDPTKADRLASDLIELSTRQSLAYFLTVSAVHRGGCASRINTRAAEQFALNDRNLHPGLTQTCRLGAERVR